MRRLRPNHPRVLFANELQAFEAVCAEQAALGPGHPIEAEYKRALYQMARACGASVAASSKAMVAPQYEHAFDKLLGKELADEVKAPFFKRIEALQEQWKERAARHELEMLRLAKLTDPWPGEQRLLYDSVCCGSYRSTCRGEFYARAMAEIRAEELTKWLGIKSVVEEVHDTVELRQAGQWLPKRIVDYKTFAYVHDMLDIELARRSPKRMPMSEAVRLAWAKGANARVYWPMLPHGYEEQHGFDFFGNPLAQ